MPISLSPIVPNRNHVPAVFSAEMQAFLAWMSQYAIDLNAVGTAYNLATSTTSVTSNSLTTGAKTFTVAAGLGFIPSMPVRIGNTASPSNYAQATVTSYSGNTLNVNFDAITGSGVGITTWSISLSAGAVGAGLGGNTFGGAQNFFQGADLVAAATVNLTTATGNVNRITGNTGISGFTLSDGFTRYGIITGTPLLTFNAVTNNMNTNGQNYQCVGGERYEAYAMSGVVYLELVRPDGAANNTTSSTKNKIINGAMKIDQRNVGVAQAIVAAAALAYTVDRFYSFCTGANITGQRIALANGQNRYRLTGAAAVTAVGFGQRIESFNCMDLAGGNANMQVKLSSSSLTAITWTAYYATTADTFGTLATPTRTQIATGSFTITATEATYNAQMAIPAAELASD